MRRSRAVQHLIDTVVHLVVLAAVAVVAALVATAAPRGPSESPGSSVVAPSLLDDPEHVAACAGCREQLRR